MITNDELREQYVDSFMTYLEEDMYDIWKEWKRWYVEKHGYMDDNLADDVLSLVHVEA